MSADPRTPEVPPSRWTGGTGRGLVGGMLTTGRALLRPAHTQEYPDVAPELHPAPAA